MSQQSDSQLGKPLPPRQSPPMNMPEMNRSMQPKNGGEELDDIGNGGCARGCFYLTTGGAGCMTVIALMVGALIVLGVQGTGGIFSNIGSGIGGIFQVVGDTLNPNGQSNFLNFNRGVVTIDNVVLPDVEAIQTLSELTTTQFNYANIVTRSTEMPGALQALYGDSLAMVAVVEIEAGIDFGAMDSEDLTFDNETNMITLTVPAPQLQDCAFNDAESYVVQRATGIFSAPLPNLDQEARQYALSILRAQAIEDGILIEAQERADELLTQFIGYFVIGDATINVMFEAAPPNPILPPNCF